MKHILSISITSALLSAAASACDACAAAIPGLGIENHLGWHVGVAEQYTSYETLRLDGRTISDSANQYLHSSITQLFFGYDFESSFGIQINLPIIARTYRGVEGDGIKSGSVSGIGDISVLAHWAPLKITRGDFSLTGRLVAGIKLPTGDTDKLSEEGHSHGGSGHEAAHEPEPAMHAMHDEHAMHGEHHAPMHEDAHTEEMHGSDFPPGGVHGHDLTLGTGSVDGIFGADVHLRWKRVFLDAGAQLIVRGDGDYGYDMADELSWFAALGATVIQEENLSVSIAARIFGDSKGEDTSNGQRQNETSSTVVYLGPQISALIQQRLNAHVGVGFPIVRENSGAMVAPDFRIEAGIGWQF